MTKWYGKIGFAETVEVTPGDWREEITERNYYGDVMSNFRNLQNSGQINDDVNISNKISILADPYAVQNFHAMRYVEFMGTKWKANSVEVQYPRLVITLGGVWNGN